ncbi:hypothetical protein P7C70_g7304, partial [Phenoliferia sp. Uapishka_3]
MSSSSGFALYSPTNLIAAKMNALTSLRASLATARQHSRSFASTSLARADSPPAAATPLPSEDASIPPPTESSEDAAAPVEAEPTLDPEKPGRSGNGYRAWLNGDGAKFRTALHGRTNWIGDTPFPMNPTFNPLPPLADSTKTKIYNAYIINLMSNSGSVDSVVVRAVSQKFGVSMDRVRAIIRLKELEKRWKDEGRTLQTELLKGMESHLGVKAPGENWRGIEPPEPEATTAPSKNRTVFEMVDVEAGDSPVFLPLLAKTSATTNAKPRRVVKDFVAPASRPGRAATVFKDVSGTFAGKAFEATRKEKTKRGKKRVEGDVQVAL